jgi:hypothetical protein
MTAESSAAEEGYLEGVTADQVSPSQDAKNSDATSGTDDTNVDGAKESKPKSLMDAVKERLAADSADGDSPAPEKEGEKEDPEGKTDADKSSEEEKPEGDEAEEEPPFHKHPAWQKQIAKRKELETQLEDLAPKAERFDQMQTMIAENDLSSDEVSAGFNIMALMKGDPTQALEQLKPYYDALLLATGETLPVELNERVDAGQLSEEDARELQRARIAKGEAEQKVRAVEARDSASQQERLGRDMAAGVSEWEADWQAKDPDYARKLPFVLDKIKAMRLDAPPPRNRAEATQMAKDALKQVNDAMKPFQPAKPEIKPTPDGSSVNAAQAPRNSMEAAQAALRNVA